MGDSILKSIHGRQVGISKHGDLILQRPNGTKRGCTKVTTITTAQLLALNATPQEIVAAPGSGLAIVLSRIALRIAAGTAYAGIAGGEDLVAKYTNGSGAQVSSVIETTGFLDQATAQVRYAHSPASSGATAGDVTPVANAAVVLHLLSGEITTGTSDLIVKVWYDIIDTVFTD
jgi:hypothetical protein